MAWQVSVTAELWLSQTSLSRACRRPPVLPSLATSCCFRSALFYSLYLLVGSLSLCTGRNPRLVPASAVMLEPLAATILTSILPARPLATQLLASKTAFGMAVRSAPVALSSDFFTPHPRRVDSKGKGKALPEDGCRACSGALRGTRLENCEPPIGAFAIIVPAHAAAKMTLCPRVRGALRIHDEADPLPPQDTTHYRSQVHGVGERCPHSLTAHMDEAS